MLNGENSSPPLQTDRQTPNTYTHSLTLMKIGSRGGGGGGGDAFAPVVAGELDATSAAAAAAAARTQLVPVV